MHACIAQPNVPEAYPSYHKSEVAPVIKWNEYGSHIKEKGTEKLHACFDNYDGLMSEVIQKATHTQDKGINGLIIAEPQMPHTLACTVGLACLH